MSELLPCPFCGYQPKVYARGGYHIDGLNNVIRCNRCRVEIEGKKYSSIMKTWNTRREPKK
jgi:Lar family restriction alleviation protein